MSSKCRFSLSFFSCCLSHTSSHFSPFIPHLFSFLIWVASWDGVYCLNEFFTIADRWPLHIFHQFLCRCIYSLRKYSDSKGKSAQETATNMYLIFIGIWPSGSFKWKCRFMCVRMHVCVCVCTRTYMRVFWVYCIQALHAQDFDTKIVLKWSLPFICMNYNIMLSYSPTESFLYWSVFINEEKNERARLRINRTANRQTMEGTWNGATKMQRTHNHLKTNLEYIIVMWSRWIHSAYSWQHLLVGWFVGWLTD